jgi:hypothetical protein
MKRILAILSSFPAAGGRPGGAVFIRPVLATVGLLLAGCAGFERDWKRALAATPPGAPGPAGVVVAGTHEGAWTGSWTSPGTGHSGRLRCVISGPAQGSGETEATFTYHATWAIFSGTFPTRQPVRRQADGSVRSVGAWSLPDWAGGRYEYDITIRGNRFTGIWKSARDSGALEMTRAVASDR